MQKYEFSKIDQRFRNLSFDFVFLSARSTAASIEPSSTGNNSPFSIL
jgi:hypothetical protein